MARARAGFGKDAGVAGAFREIDCVRHLLPRERIAAAEARAEKLGIGADRILIAAGHLDEEDYLRSLGAALGVAFEPLDGTPRTACPLDDERLIEAAANGMLPLADGEDLTLVVAPRAGAARRIGDLIRAHPEQACHFRFASNERIVRFALRCAGKSLAARAADGLKESRPDLSAGPPRRRAMVAATIAGLAVLAAAALALPKTMFPIEVVLAGGFLAWLALRLIGAVVDWAWEVWRGRGGDPPERELPLYSVIAALYREAASVDGLLAAIGRLDYPREKLDVIVAVEADDRETRAALERRASRLPITVIPVAAVGPRTKPKALNVALAFARGQYTVIYDAEDRPERDQLRRALAAFRAGPERLACVQARLCIDNTADGWLARLFTAEYAGQFDVFLPGIAALNLPLPLGGSSNHFRTETLRKVGGWDAYNVTEDADLGMRLARFGYRAGVIGSTTYEEAPNRLGPWLKQRTRWFKGWMRPVKLSRNIRYFRPLRLLHRLDIRASQRYRNNICKSALRADPALDDAHVAGVGQQGLLLLEALGELVAAGRDGVVGAGGDGGEGEALEDRHGPSP